MAKQLKDFHLHVFCALQKQGEALAPAATSCTAGHKLLRSGYLICRSKAKQRHRAPSSKTIKNFRTEQSIKPNAGLFWELDTMPLHRLHAPDAHPASEWKEAHLRPVKAHCPCNVAKEDILRSQWPDSRGMSRAGDYPGKKAGAAVWSIQTEGWDSRVIKEIENLGTTEKHAQQ